MLSLSKHDQAWWVGLRRTFYRTAMIVGSGLLVVLAGVLDVRELIDLFWIGDEDDVCQYASFFDVECAPCPSDGESYCVGIKAEGFSGTEAPGLSLQEIGPDDIGPECDDDDDDNDDDRSH